MTKIGFYLMGRKGSAVLRRCLEREAPPVIAFVVAARDAAMLDDGFEPIRALCATHRLPFFEHPARPDTVDATASIAVGWRWLIPDSANLIVLHDSLLPAYRGFAPLVNMLIDGAKRIGATAFRASADYDRGDILAQAGLDIRYPIKVMTAIDLLADTYADLVDALVDRMARGEDLSGTPQDESLASYGMWRDESDYAIDWTRDAESIRRFCDAVGPPYAGASCFAGTRKLRILHVEPCADVRIADRQAHLGKVIFVRAGRPVIVCGSGLLTLHEAVFADGGADAVGKLPFRTRLTPTPAGP